MPPSNEDLDQKTTEKSQNDIERAEESYGEGDDVQEIAFLFASRCVTVPFPFKELELVNNSSYTGLNW